MRLSAQSLAVPMKAAYTIFMALSSCLAVISIVYRVRNARLVRQHLKTLASDQVGR
jgi:hypothetical protein